jgi:hypothetical protein
VVAADSACLCTATTFLCTEASGHRVRLQPETGSATCRLLTCAICLYCGGKTTRVVAKRCASLQMQHSNKGGAHRRSFATG